MKRSFLILTVLTLLALLVVVFAPEDGSLQQAETNTLFLPGILEQVNEVNRVEIIIAANRTVATLVKEANSWQVEQMDGYRANWPALQTLLAALAQARVQEQKTDKPEYYARLGVEGVDAENAGSVLLRISVGDQTTAILVGREAQGRSGQYVRLQDAQGSVLLDRNLDVSTEQLDWVDSRIVDINASEVAEVEIIHPQGERLFVTRISADQTDFDLVGLPLDREIKSSWAVNSLGSMFSLLDMNTVRSVESVDWSNAVKIRMLLFSGVEILADLVEIDDEYLLRLHASHPAANVVGSPPGESEISIEQQDIEKRAEEDVATTVEGINRKVMGWAYGISSQKYDAMVKKPEDLLKPVESS